MPNIVSIVFFIFSIIVLCSAVMMIFVKNPVQAVLWLILAFFACAGIWLMLYAEFLALVLVLVYIGAVIVLFLFIIMMLDIDIEALKSGFVKYLPVALVMSMAIIGSLIYSFHAYKINTVKKDILNLETLAVKLYTNYVLIFELSGMLLLIAIVAAIALSLRGPRERLTQSPSKQVNVKPRERVQLVKDL